MTLEDSVLQQRLRVMQRAQVLGNISAACREAGVSRTLFYRWRRRFVKYGSEGLHPKRRQARRGRPPSVPIHVERQVVGLALSWPTWGSPRLASQMAHLYQIRLCPSTVQRILRRAGLPTRRERLAVLEVHSAGGTGLLTERTRRQLEKARKTAPRHVAAEKPGDLVCLDTFYIGKLKGVGKIWQVTACDAGCSYGVARLIPAFEAKHTAAFLRKVLVPLYRRAGWTLKRVLTDQGAEFRGAFDTVCQQLGIRHTRTKPRHAWTNGFVERLQGTILEEHWRIQFRRRYFTGRQAMEKTLQAFLRFYNYQRPHQGYRVRGQVPAALFWGAAGVVQ